MRRFQAGLVFLVGLSCTAAACTDLDLPRGVVILMAFVGGFLLGQAGIDLFRHKETSRDVPVHARD